MQNEYDNYIFNNCRILYKIIENLKNLSTKPYSSFHAVLSVKSLGNRSSLAFYVTNK